MKHLIWSRTPSVRNERKVSDETLLSRLYVKCVFQRAMRGWTGGGGGRDTGIRGRGTGGKRGGDGGREGAGGRGKEGAGDGGRGGAGVGNIWGGGYI